MAVSVVDDSLNRNSAGSRIGVTARVAFTTYETGGPALLASDFGLSVIDTLSVVGDFGGYSIDPLVATGGQSVNLKVSAQGAGTFSGAALATHSHNAQNAIEEVVSVTAGTGVSAALTSIPVSLVESVYVTAGGVSGPYTLVPAGVSGTTLVSINHTTGVLQFLIADAVTSAKVTYLKTATTSVSAGTPSGTVSAGSAGEVSNGTDLSALDSVLIQAYGS